MNKYWVPQKLPQIHTAIAYICIGKFSWFAVYICCNLWNALYILLVNSFVGEGRKIHFSQLLGVLWIIVKFWFWIYDSEQCSVCLWFYVNFMHSIPMVLILDGSLEHSALIWSKSGISICWRLSVTSKESSNPIFLC